MSYRIVQQPNGLLARFSGIVDNFTHCNLTESEAIRICQLVTPGSSAASVANEVAIALENPGRWEESLDIVRTIHGEAFVQQILDFCDRTV